MPIETPSGVLEVENAKLRASSIEATIAVGIGTESNDAYPLQVFKETEPDIRIQEGSTISSASRIYSNNSNLYIQTGSNFTSGSSGDVAFQTMEGASTHMVIKSDGKVGVGTTSPENSLHIFKSGNEQTSGLFIEKQNVGTGTAQITFGVNGSSENVGVAKAGIFFERGSSNGRGDLKFCVDNTNDANNVGVSDAAMTIYRDGNVGIGTVSPIAKLHVNGNFYAPGSLVQVQTLQSTLSYSTTGAATGGEISTTYNTGLKLSITPTKNTSRILVSFNFLIFLDNQVSDGANGGRCQIFRKINGQNRTRVYGVGTGGHDLHFYLGDPRALHAYTHIEFEDTPNTTGTCEYELAAMLYNSRGTLHIGNVGNQPVTVRLMEIGA